MNQQETVLKILKELSRVGRRVAMLLAYLSEYGPQTKEALEHAFPGGVKGELPVCNRTDYIGKNAMRYYIRPRGVEVVNWLTVKTDTIPDHWLEWELLAKAKQDGGKPAVEVMHQIIRMKKLKR